MLRTLAVISATCTSLLVVTLASCSSSGSSEATTPPAAAAVAETTAPSTPQTPVGDETIHLADLRAHVTRLSSDEFKGRGTNEPGARLAADYLVAHMAKYGLRPMPGHESLRVDYKLQQVGFDTTKTTATTTVSGTAKTLRAGADFAPFSFSDVGTADAEVVFAGYGITAPKLGWDDYAKLDVKGKLVLLLRHTPNEKDKASPFNPTRHGSFASKALNALKHGAVGMLLVTDPKHHEGGDDLRMGGFLRLPPSTDPKNDDPRMARMRRRAAAPKGAQFLAVHISRQTATELVSPSKKSLLQLQTAVDTGTKPSTFSLVGTRTSITLVKNKEPAAVVAQNVVGFLEGSDPVLKHEWVMVGAHYDHLGAFKGPGDTVYTGADDNASGTTGMLSLARAFASLPTRPKRSMVFVGFSGEEKGLLGSRAMVSQKLMPVDKLVFMMNLDMIGRNADRPIAVVGDGYGTGLKQAVAQVNKTVALRLEYGGTDYAANSDHHSFFAKDIPVLFFFTGTHDDYHQLSDHVDKIAFERMTKIVRLAYGVVDQVAQGVVTPTFVHHISWLGVAIQSKSLGDEQRAVVTAVDPNSRAAKAGITLGDVVTQVGDKPVTMPKHIGRLFSTLKPGTKSELVVVRGGVSTDIAIERARRGYLGVMPMGLGDDERKKLGLAKDEGVKIRGLAGSGPAGKAGIKAGDILIRIAGHPVGLRTLGRQLARIGAGERVTITVIRAGKRVKLKLTLGVRPTR